MLLHSRKVLAHSATPAELAGFANTVSSKPPLFFEQVPGLTALLQHLMPVQARREALAPTARGEKKTPKSSTRRLVAHLTPSPSTHLGVEVLYALPRITMDFELSDAHIPNKAHGETAQLVNVTAAVIRQELDVAFPTQTGDLSFSRERTAELRKDAWQSNGQIQELAQKVQLWLASPKSGLPTMFDLAIDLPSFLLGPLSTQREETSRPNAGMTVPYFISHYEEITSVDFVAIQDEARLASLHPKVRELAECWPADMVLRCKEVDAGAFGGRRTEATLLRLPRGTDDGTVSPSADSAADTEPAHEYGSDATELVKTATRMLRIMTRADSGRSHSDGEADAEEGGAD